MWIDIPASSESHAFMVVWLFYMGCFFWISSGRSSCSPWFWDHMWFISKSSHVHTCISQPGWILARRLRVHWHHLLWGVTLSLFDSQGVFLCRCHWDNLLDLENWDICDLYLLSGQGPAPLCPCHYHGLKVSPGGNVQLFTLFLLLFISGSVNRRLVVNV